MPRKKPGSGADKVIAEAFEEYHGRFREIGGRARGRFEARDWQGQRRDALERLSLYSSVMDRTEALLRKKWAGGGARAWRLAKKNYSVWIASRDDSEIAATFFNSALRRVVSHTGVYPSMEFSGDEVAPPPPGAAAGDVRVYGLGQNTAEGIRAVLTDRSFRAPFEDLSRDAGRVAGRIDDRLSGRAADRMEVLSPVFYRNKGAYLIGRIVRGRELIPMVIPLLHGPRGIAVDALLLNADEISMVFSFTRSYFHAEISHPGGAVQFLKSLMPLKPISELYISLGFNKHGKTELFRELTRRLADSREAFETAPGERGMVMSVFTLPSHDVVFKIIKDRFDPPKTSSPEEVRKKYQLVFTHDRAGRLIDAQEFEHLEFPRRRFGRKLLADLSAAAGNTVKVRAKSVRIRHLYTERRLTPLNLYLKTAPGSAAQEVVMDYGQAIRDLAANNIFPGDVLLKNFGVTRHGRVVFYDYDELCLVTDCNFRDFPASFDPHDEISPEPWFYVGENDIFPEEFRHFLGLSGPLEEAFLGAHADLFTASFWRKCQETIRAGVIADIFPYKASSRFLYAGLEV